MGMDRLVSPIFGYLINSVYLYKFFYFIFRYFVPKCTKYTVYKSIQVYRKDIFFQIFYPMSLNMPTDRSMCEYSGSLSMEGDVILLVVGMESSVYR